MLRYLLLTLLLLSLLSGTALAQTDTEDLPRFTILETDTPLELTFEEDFTTFLASFNATEGDVVSVSMTQDPESVLDPYLILLGPAGEVLAYDDDGGEEVTFSSLIADFEIPATGSYFIVATGLAYGLSAEPIEEPQSFELLVSGNTVPEGMEEGNQFMTGNIEIGTALDAQITAEEPVFYFLLQAEEGQTLDITMTSEDFDGLLYVFSAVEDASGVRLAVDDDTNDLNPAIQGLEIPATGWYLIFATASDYPFAADPDWENFGTFNIAVSEGK